MFDYVCECLQQQIGEITGIIETSANQRTGRVLVWYDDNHIDGQNLALLIDRIALLYREFYQTFRFRRENP